MDVVRNSGTAIHMQIAHIIVTQIDQGYLLPGLALPGSRELSQLLKVNRKTVIQAYDELIAQGWLTAEYRRGTFVSQRSTDKKLAKFSPVLANQNVPQSNSQINQLQIAFQVNNVLSPTSHHNLAQNNIPTELIDFSVDLPDVRLAPLKAISSALRHALSANVKKYSAQNDSPLGTTELRQAILQMVNMERNLGAQLAQTCVVHNSKMAIYITAQAIIQPGNIIVVDTLISDATREIFKNCGAVILDIRHITQDMGQGIDLEELHSLCLQNKIRAVYVKPHSDMAMGISMSPAHKKQLLNLAIQFNFMIIEDDQDAEFDDSQPLNFPIASLEQQQVIYIGSFSRILSPHFNTAYIIVPLSLVEVCANSMHLMGCKDNKVTELALATLLNSGKIKKHIARATKIYTERRNFICMLINRELGEYASTLIPNKGFGIWLNIDTRLNMKLLLDDASKFGLKLTQADQHTNTKKQVNNLRLGFAHLSKDEISAGIKQLKNVFDMQPKQKLSA